MFTTFRHPVLSSVCLVVAVVASVSGPVPAQSFQSGPAPNASCLVIPQSRVVPGIGGASVEVAGVTVGTVILEQVATTTIDVDLRNPTSRALEAELLVPVPDGATIRSFTFQGSGAEPSARLLPKDEADRLYDSIVRRLKDPALLEFAGYNLVRSSVFPVAASGAQKVRISYEHVLDRDGNRVDYVIPRSENLGYQIPWQINVKVTSSRPISTVYSPSHEIQIVRHGAGHIATRVRETSIREPGPFRLSYLLSGGSVSASLLAYPDKGIGGGYFLLLAGLPPKEPSGPKIKRELTLVIDRSGSMRGRKLEQVREAALGILAGLDEGEAFNIIVYDATVEAFSPEPVTKTPESARKAEEYLRSIRSTGGTNLHDALFEALRQKPAPNTLPLVLFLTDGLPTVGETSELAIRMLAEKSNPYSRRVFTFGVGVDVNTPLLERVSSLTRATATFVLPDDDVEVKVSRVFDRLQGPVLADVGLEILGIDGKATKLRTQDVTPPQIPDLFAGDQLVVVGRYRGSDPLRFILRGQGGSGGKSFQFSFDLDKATTRNAFVPRLWASRQIGYLEDAIRDLGADPLRTASTGAASADPRLKELVDEIVRLSTEFGILSEYTAFLANEGTDLSQKDSVTAMACDNFYRRSIKVRSGAASTNQDLNRVRQKSQIILNNRNMYCDHNLNRVAIANVQQIADRTFYRRNKRWVDARVVEREKTQPRSVVRFGTTEFHTLLKRLTAEGRQGCVSLRGEILLEVDGEPVLVTPEEGALEEPQK